MLTGNDLRLLRTHAGLSRRELAELVGVTRESVKQWEERGARVLPFRRWRIVEGVLTRGLDAESAELRALRAEALSLRLAARVDELERAIAEIRSQQAKRAGGSTA